MRMAAPCRLHPSRVLLARCGRERILLVEAQATTHGL